MSEHSHHGSAAVPDIQLGSRAASFERISGVIGGLGLLLCLAGFFWNRTIFFQSYLFAFIYWAGFALGGLGLLLLNNVVGGRWGVTTRSFLVAAMRTLPLVGILILPLIFIAIGVWLVIRRIGDTPQVPPPGPGTQGGAQ